MKMVIVVYNEVLDEEVVDCFNKCGINGYTKIPVAYGKGLSSGGHFGNDIWPGKNIVIFCACEDEVAMKIKEEVEVFKERFKKEGVKAFFFSIEDMI